MIKKIVAFVPAPIVVWLQSWYDIFHTALISYPEWPTQLGAMSVGIGSVTILPFIALWNRIDAKWQTKYMVVSTVVFVASILVCLALQLIFSTLLLPNSQVFELLLAVWRLAFIAFGVSLAHLLTGFLLHRLP